MFAENLRYLRKKHHLSQTALSHRLGRKSVASVSEWESGKYTPQLAIIEKVAALFEVDVTDLLYRELGKANEPKSRPESFLSMYSKLTPDRQRKVYQRILKLQETESEDDQTPIEQPVTILKLERTDLAIADEKELVNWSQRAGKAGKPNFDFAVKIIGSSMLPKFCDQQIVFVTAATKAENGQVVLVKVDGKPYIRRYEKTAEGTWLMPFNQDEAQIKIQDDADFRLIGVVTGLLEE
ncbi:XRE family transcriptional regulator [Lentilactobacillus hilgardii]|nr:XRE family transcriptional regulator [Lentilactobacillus hilgardii]MCV3741760.1 XRE family transcriptional regulator [Lentilactobacillus hilgardii]